MRTILKTCEAMTCSTSIVHYKFLKSEIKVSTSLASEDILPNGAAVSPVSIYTEKEPNKPLMIDRSNCSDSDASKSTNMNNNLRRLSNGNAKATETQDSLETICATKPTVVNNNFNTNSPPSPTSPDNLMGLLKSDINNKDTIGPEALFFNPNKELNGGVEDFQTIPPWSLEVAKENLLTNNNDNSKNNHLPHYSNVSNEIVEESVVESADSDSIPILIKSELTEDGEEETVKASSSIHDDVDIKEDELSLTPKDSQESKESLSSFSHISVKSDLEFDNDYLKRTARKIKKRLQHLQLKQAKNSLTPQLRVFTQNQQRLKGVECSSYEETSFKSLQIESLTTGTCLKKLHHDSPKKHHESQHHDGTASSSEIDKSLERQRTAATLNSIRHNFRHSQRCYDSDATDSSNAESDEEGPISGNKPTTEAVKRVTPSLSKRCLESYSKSYNLTIERFQKKIAANDMISKFSRSSRGPILFGTDQNKRLVPPYVKSEPEPMDEDIKLELTTNPVNDQQQQPEVSSNDVVFVSESSTPDGDGQCMRTMPFVGMKPRRILQPDYTLAVMKKVTVTGQYTEKPSVKCVCKMFSRDIAPCVLCRGDYNSTMEINPDQMSFDERKSLLLSSHHPTLSFDNGCSLGFAFMELLSSPDYKVKFTSSKSHSKKKKQSSVSLDSNGTPTIGSEKPAKIFLPSGIPQRPKKERKEKEKNKPPTPIDRKRPRLSFDSRHDLSPPPSPAPSETSSADPAIQTLTQRRRRSDAQHAYDINNFVIPSSMTTTARIEKLEYKEIITPAWSFREEYSIPPPEELIKSYEPSEESEDLTDEAFLTRHSIAQEKELARIQSYMTDTGNLKGIMRKSGAQRIRFEVTNDERSQDSLTNSKLNSKTGKSKAERRRNPSISRERTITESFEDDQRMFIMPYEPRNFPLSEMDYRDMLAEQDEVNLHNNFSTHERKDLESVSVDFPTEMVIVEEVIEEDPEWEPSKIQS